MEVSLDVLIALLGGADAQTALTHQGTATGVPDAELLTALDAPRAWLSPGITAAEPSAGVVRQFALEVASLKLRCFEALLRSLIASKHIGSLPAKRLRGHLPNKPGMMRPIRWGFEIVIQQSANATNTGNLGLDLGNLLARLLLANDQRTPAKAEQLAIATLQKFSMAASKLQGGGAEQIEEAALANLTRGDIADSNGILYAGGMRNRIAGAAIPPAIWLAATKLILRLQTNIEGFSFGPAPLQELAAEVAMLGQQLDIATFGAMARRTEIEAVLRRQLETLSKRS